MSFSSEVDASLDHLLGVFGLRAFSNGLALLKGDLLLLGVLVVEPDTLVERHRLLVLILNFKIHALVLVPVIAHLVEALVFLGTPRLFVDYFSEAVKGGLEFLPGHLSIFVGVELLNEHINFLFEGGEPVGFEQQDLNLLAGNEAAVVAVDALEGRLELGVGEHVQAEGVREGGLELVGGSQSGYTEESHYL